MKLRTISTLILISTCASALLSGKAMSANYSAPDNLKKNAISNSCIFSSVQATSKVQMAINLSSNDSVPSIPFDPSNELSYNYVANGTIFDSLGIEHTLGFYFVKNNLNSWTAHVLIDGNNNIGTGTLEFSTAGNLTSVTGLNNLSWTPSTGATSPQIFSIDMACSTQVSIADQILSFWQDGHTEGPSFHAVLNANHLLNKNSSESSCLTLHPHATTVVKWHINLNAANFIPESPFNPKDVTSYNYKTEIGVFDSLGAPYYLTMYYVKNGINSWSAYAYMYLTSLGSGKLVFNSDGSLTSVKGLDNLSWLPYSGAESPQFFSIDMTCSTQYGSPSGPEEAPWQNGQGSGLSPFLKKPA